MHLLHVCVLFKGAYVVRAVALSVVLAEQEGENLSGLSDNPDKAIFAVRENGTTCLMVEFAVKFLVPYDVLALNGIDSRRLSRCPVGQKSRGYVGAPNRKSTSPGRTTPISSAFTSPRCINGNIIGTIKLTLILT
ncbi:hypothetical protein XENOCAPTIV_010921 [Xenoophorus captivus]|uniref:Secreted protein n=1 Tax=Xenoophorus captivus TaxID=1517983 RepID=A0ABV0RC19_9TELE